MRIVAVVGSVTKNKEDYIRCGRLVGPLFGMLNKNTDFIVSGGAATGADAWARKYSGQYGFSYLEVPGLYQPCSSMRPRSATIAAVCDLALVVWDGRDRGTSHFVREMDKLGKKYWAIQL
jgi:hypothetical protein